MVSTHDYLSTGCLHGDLVLPDGRTGHEYCQGDTGAAGAKVPAVCKFCPSKCACPCHQGVDMTATPAPEFTADVRGLWAWRCNGGPGCDGWAGLHQHSEQAARQTWADHVRREHRAAVVVEFPEGGTEGQRALWWAEFRKRERAAERRRGKAVRQLPVVRGLTAGLLALRARRRR